MPFTAQKNEDAELTGDISEGLEEFEEPDKKSLSNLEDAVTAYFKKINVPLLSREEERELAEKIAFARQKFQDAALSYSGVKKQFGEEARRTKHRAVNTKHFDNIIKRDFVCVQLLKTIVDSAEVYAKDRKVIDEEYWKYVQTREEMIKKNLQLTPFVAKNYQGRGMEMADLVGMGNLGLIKAVDRYEAGRGFKLSTYATWWIKQAITRQLVDDKFIRLPAHVFPWLAEWNKLKFDENGRVRSFDEIYRKLSEQENGKLPGQETFVSWLKASVSTRPRSLDTLFGDDRDAFEPEDKRADNPYQKLEFKGDNEKIEKALAELPKRDAEVLRMRYGLDGKKPMSLQEVGDVIHLCRERVRQIENKALRKLKWMLSRQHVNYVFEAEGETPANFINKAKIEQQMPETSARPQTKQIKDLSPPKLSADDKLCLESLAGRCFNDLKQEKERATNEDLSYASYKQLRDYFAGLAIVARICDGKIKNQIISEYASLQDAYIDKVLKLLPADEKVLAELSAVEKEVNAVCAVEQRLNEKWDFIRRSGNLPSTGDMAELAEMRKKVDARDELKQKRAELRSLADNYEKIVANLKALKAMTASERIKHEIPDLEQMLQQAGTTPVCDANTATSPYSPPLKRVHEKAPELVALLQLKTVIDKYPTGRKFKAKAVKKELPDQYFEARIIHTYLRHAAVLFGVKTNGAREFVKVPTKPIDETAFLAKCKQYLRSEDQHAINKFYLQRAVNSLRDELQGKTAVFTLNDVQRKLREDDIDIPNKAIGVNFATLSESYGIRIVDASKKGPKRQYQLC